MIVLYLLIAFAALRFLVVFVNLLTRQWLPPAKTVGAESVSVLIPARNEEQGIGSLLRSLLAINRDGASGFTSPVITEIIVYNDQSTDNTAGEVEAVEDVNGIIRMVNGSDLPAGWLGKNYACHRLAEEASGDWLLFLDADVQVSPSLIRDAVGQARKKHLRLLSLFPKQIMKTRGEWLVVPLMNWILVSLLPLILIRTCRWTSFSAANGQFMLFDATIYKRFRWHEQVKSNPVEDILISRLMKKKKFRTATLLSAGQIQCRMYDSTGQALNGFSKNIGQFFGNSLLWMLLFTLFTTLLPLVLIPVLVGFPNYSCQLPSPFCDLPLSLGIYFSLILLIRIGFSLLSRQNVLRNLFFWLPQQMALLVLVWKSILFRSGRKIDWKGRSV
jgi:glycosyltransferase involved in cell wall biosynthesis